MSTAVKAGNAELNATLQITLPYLPADHPVLTKAQTKAYDPAWHIVIPIVMPP